MIVKNICPHTELECPKYTDYLKTSNILHKYSIYESTFRNIQEVMKSEKGEHYKIEQIDALIKRIEQMERQMDRIILMKEWEQGKEKNDD